MEVLLPHLQHFVATYGYFAVFLIVAMESAGIPMPGETVLVTAAIFAASGTLNIFGVIGSAAAGAIIGDNCGYWICPRARFSTHLPIRALYSSGQKAAQGRAISFSQARRKDCVFRPFRRGAARV